MRIDNTWIGTIARKTYNLLQFKFISHYYNLYFMKKLMKQEDFRFFPQEAFMIQTLAKRQINVEGDYAEVGVYQGCSARMICDMKENKTLHLFDTFEGMPSEEGDYKLGMFGINKSKAFIESYKEGKEKYNYLFNLVKSKLVMYDKVFMYKGLFPATGKPIENKKFSFVHLDVDIYSSTLDCLKFFYPKMSKGGIILTHDYVNEGVIKAFKEYFKDKPEKVINLITQGMVVKE